MSKDSEKLAILEANQINMEKKFDDFIDVRFTKFEEKIDTVLNTKADKKEVDTLSKTVEDLKMWKIKLVAIGSLILFVVTFLKDPILELIKNI